MIERFIGSDGHRRTAEALRAQMIIGDDQELAGRIAKLSSIVAIEPGSTILKEDASDNDIFFILAGTVSVQVRGREVATRIAGQHVGEMALVDPKKPRCASVVAVDDVVVAKVSEPDFTGLAESNPRMWRNIARELADRLRERNLSVEPLNEQPKLFLGCTTESLEVAREIQSNLSHDPIIVKVWTDGVFGASRFPIEDLERELQSSDFAAIIVTPDDHVVSRGQGFDAPRDNVVFELGLCMGALQRHRTFLVCPRNTDVKIPTDLLGIKPLEYSPEPESELAAMIAPACNELRKTIVRAGGR